MKPAAKWLVAASVSFVVWGPCTVGRAVISDHLFRGRISHGAVYDDPVYETPLHIFQLELETDAGVDYVEFLTPAGYAEIIPADESTSSDEIETFHWTYDSTHVWEYWGYFIDPEPVGDLYGDGEYVIVVHYADGREEETAVWYGVPRTTEAIAAPTQQPDLIRPPYDGVIASPVTFEWSPVTDPHVGDIFLGVLDANDRYAISDVYDANATGSGSRGVPEGGYDVELSFENFYAVTTPDGIPFDLLKMTTTLHPFEVVYSTVYRFWLPTPGRHFYTIDEDEKDWLIDTYPDIWAFEGPAFHAWTTRYFPGLAPIHRFWSDLYRAHFYTIDETERDWLLANYPHVWTYEGVAFYAYPEGRQPDDASPVYRFWNVLNGSHFYTVDTEEADLLLTRYAHLFAFEGTAFYVYE